MRGEVRRGGVGYVGLVSFFGSFFFLRMMGSYWRILIEEICVSENDCGCAWSMDIRCKFGNREIY